MFDLFVSFFNIVLYQPLFNALVFLYEYLPGRDFGIAVIILTLLIRLILYPLWAKSIRAQKALSQIQPRIKEIQKRFKHDKEQQGRAMMELYRKEKINPFSSLLPLLLQLPILIAIYRVFLTLNNGLDPGELAALYPFVHYSNQFNTLFLGTMDLAAPFLPLAFLAGLLQFFQSKMIISLQSFGKSSDRQKTRDQMAQFSDMMSKQMLYFFPFLTVLILWKLPSAIGLYWVVLTLFAIVQQHFTLNKGVRH